MTARNITSRFGQTALAAFGIGALLLSVGCAGSDRSGTATLQAAAAAQGVQPVVVACEPHQRAVVRPSMVNGAAVSQVECVSTGVAAAGDPRVAVQSFTPAQAPVYRQVSAPQPVYDDLGDARVITAPASRPVQTRQVIYDREPVRQTRSVKKSAIIIGSSAGVGAGVGAAVGGKKGALIGAAIGGGSAAVWDQVTRRK
ncbi:MAG TPA: hypothetical protein VD833_00520 [Vicinamibacterales bacterium]|nr:hypothetical protein [Vicinamibacterales bacterium]